MQDKTIAAIKASFAKHGDGDIRKLAYILATAKHETNLVPKEEVRAKPGTRLYENQKRYWGWHGRGLVQLTWKDNYERFSELLGVDLVKNPELLITDLALSADVLVIGMMKGEFTGKSLHKYINKKYDFYNARRVVNGLDRAMLVAKYAVEFLNQLKNN